MLNDPEVRICRLFHYCHEILIFIEPDSGGSSRRDNKKRLLLPDVLNSIYQGELMENLKE